MTSESPSCSDHENDNVRHPPAPTNISSNIQLDPALVLTPDHSDIPSKKSVTFLSPAKPNTKARRRLGSNKENVLSSVDLPLEPVVKQKPVNTKNKQKTKSTQRKIRVQKESRASVNTEEANLDIPELHTTLSIGRNIQQVHNLELDVVSAVKNRLTISDKDRISVKQKSYAALNKQLEEKEYCGDHIVLDVHSEAVVAPAEKNLLKSVKAVPHKKKPTTDQPSLKKMYSKDLVFTDHISLDLHGYEPRSLKIKQPSLNFSKSSRKLLQRTLSYQHST